MPGVILKRPLTLDELWIQEIRVRGRIAKLPTNLNVLRALVQALLTRISLIKDETEEKWLRREIEGLAGLEGLCNSLEESSDAVKKDALEAWLFKIARSEVPRNRVKAHDPAVLRIQRRTLNEIILTARYQHLSERARRKWLQDNWNDIMSKLHGVPCWCEYDVKDLVKAPRTTTLDELVQCGSNAELQKEILAELHDIKIRQVEKLLGPRSK